MKKLVLAVALLATSTAALADRDMRGPGYGYRGYEHHHHSDLTPFIVGAVTGAVIYDIYNRPRVVQQPQVIYTQPRVIYVQPTYHYEYIYDSYCNCDREVLVRD